MKHLYRAYLEPAICKKLGKAFVLSLLFVSIFARAEIVSVGPHQISIPLPSGHCLLDETNPNHKRVIEITRESLKVAKNVFLYQSADCDNLAAWLRGDGPLVDTGIAAASLTASQYKVPMSQKEFVSTMRNAYIELGTKAIDNHVDEISKALNELKIRQHSIIDKREVLGIIGDDHYAMYVAFFVKLSSSDYGAMELIGVRGFTLVDGKLVFLELGSNNQNPDDLLQLLAGVKEWVDRVQREN